MKNIIFDYDKKEIIGLINSVDTGMSTAIINDDKTLSQLQVNWKIQERLTPCGKSD